jgi:hypothetical protein
MNKVVYIFVLASFFLTPSHFFGQHLENAGFENWEDLPGTPLMEPVDWSTIKSSDDPGISILAPVTYARVEDAHSGDYALKLYNVTAFNVVATGAITNGRFHADFNLDESYSFTQLDSAEWHTVFTWRPDSLVGWFKYFPNEDDKAQFKVILHVGECKLPENGTLDNWVGLGVYFTQPGVTYSNWTRFSVPFNYFKEISPAFELTVLNSGDSTTAVDGSYLIVDDLDVIYAPQSIAEPENEKPFLVAAPGKLSITLESTETYQGQWFYLIDISGQTVFSRQLDGDLVPLPEGLPEGVYVAVLQGTEQQYIQKVMIR